MSIINSLQQANILLKRGEQYAFDANRDGKVQDSEIIPDTNHNGKQDLPEVLDFVVHNVQFMPDIEYSGEARLALYTALKKQECILLQKYDASVDTISDTERSLLESQIKLIHNKIQNIIGVDIDFDSLFYLSMRKDITEIVKQEYINVFGEIPPEFDINAVTVIYGAGEVGLFATSMGIVLKDTVDNIKAFVVSLNDGRTLFISASPFDITLFENNKNIIKSFSTYVLMINPDLTISGRFDQERWRKVLE